jgi:hypothetical protein
MSALICFPILIGAGLLFFLFGATVMAANHKRGQGYEEWRFNRLFGEILMALSLGAFHTLFLLCLISYAFNMIST